MVLAGFVAFLGAAASASASLSVGATVRPGATAWPAIAIERGAVIVSNVRGVAVSADRGTVRRTTAGTAVITAAAPGTIVTLTY